ADLRATSLLLGSVHGRRPLNRRLDRPRLLALRVFGVLAITILGATGAMAGAEAWWVTATFEPREAAIEGISVRNLDGGWLRASVLRTADLPRTASDPGESVEDHGFQLALHADLDGDGQPEKVVVGVFQTRSGERGRFLLILGKSEKAGTWTKRALFAEPGTPGFSAVRLEDGRLVWVTCFECDSACEVRYRSGRFRLRCGSCC
ncbi:MAG: hypothetical protein ACRDGM_11815, partial [bacterium]